MSTSRSDDIRRLCEMWVSAAMPRTGGLTLGGATEAARLRRNGIVFHELSFDELRATAIGLSRVLLLPGYNTVIDADHELFWSWTGELLLLRRSGVFTREEHAIADLLSTCVRASLAKAKYPTQPTDEPGAERKSRDGGDVHARELVSKAHLVLTYLTMPLLEAVAKKACSAYVTYSGDVIQQFTVDRGAGSTRQYSANKRCSSLRDLLWLLYNHVANDDLRSDLDEMRAHLHTLDSSQDPFDLIYSWRNTSLHGSGQYPTIGGTLLNLCMLILLYEVRLTFDSLQPQVLQHVKQELRASEYVGFRTHQSYYPPH